MNSGEFAGRVALVTGGSRGIGRACCELLGGGGARVAINYVTNDSAAKETAERVEAAGGRAHIVRADVASPEQVTAMVEDVSQELGPVELLVNNAGVFDYVPIEETTLEVWQRALDTNLTSAYLTTWAVKDKMIARGFGRVVNVASIAGLRPRPNCIAYAASKAGMISFTKSLAEALAPHDVRVNAVAPGLIKTDIIADMDPKVLDAFADVTPVKRHGTPKEIAEVVAFLLSERSSFMTGQTIVASGGRVMLP